MDLIQLDVQRNNYIFPQKGMSLCQRKNDINLKTE